MEYLPAIISALGTIIAAYFAYNQYAKNKMTDLKIEQHKNELEEKSRQTNQNIAQIYGALWYVLHEFSADRVYILQPHPLTNNLYLSIGYEVNRNGVAGMKSVVQNLPMSDVPAFSAELSQHDFLCVDDIEHNLKDKRARSILSCNGSHSAIIRKLTDDRHEWIGSLFCEYLASNEVDMIYAKDKLANVANKLQYILPEYKQITKP